MAAGVDAQLLVLGGRAHEGLGIAAQMQRHAGQLPTVNIGTVILSQCACAPRKAPLSRLLRSQRHIVLFFQRVGLMLRRRGRAGGASDAAVNQWS